MEDELRRRVLERAVEIAGGRQWLRARLGVSDHTLDQWLHGRKRFPEEVFYLAVDLVLDDDIARMAQDRRQAPREAALGEVAQPSSVRSS